MKTIIKIFICLSLIYTPYFAFASAAEKWTIEEISYDNVAKNIKIQAEKNFGPSANDNKYKVKVPVTASAAGSTALSMFKMGIAGVALYGLVEGVGWIIENGIVKNLMKLKHLLILLFLISIKLQINMMVLFQLPQL